jgi:hypothetical protein
MLGGELVAENPDPKHAVWALRHPPDWLGQAQPGSQTSGRHPIRALIEPFQHASIHRAAVIRLSIAIGLSLIRQVASCSEVVEIRRRRLHPAGATTRDQRH